MTDYSERGAIPTEDAVVEHPPTVDEVLEEQRRRERADQRDHDQRDEDQRDGGAITEDSPSP
jgi:hypothetical protein